jgi:isovaleryl-CoA dehydrogenase
MDVVLPYVHERKQFGTKIGSFQIIQAKLADMYVALQASRALTYSTARALDRGELAPKDCAAAILHAAEHATRCALDAIQVLATTPRLPCGLHAYWFPLQASARFN